MKMEWVETRPNGKPVEPGTFCRVLDMEDGTNPIYYYGKTEQEVNDKIALNNMHAQRALARRAETPPQNGTATPSPVTPRKRMTADETMQATTDLQNPAKAAEAVTKLVQDATGMDLRQMAMDAFKTRADEWVKETPDFYNCKPNRSLLATRLGVLVNGDVARISKEMMTQTFHQMLEAGDLVEDPGEAAPNVAAQNVTAFPDENQVQRVETSRGGRSGTGTRSTNFRTPPQGVQTRTLKYTREQIDRMSLAKTEALIRSTGQDGKDYAEACEFYYPSAKAMA
jgi:hypothetical protein